MEQSVLEDAANEAILRAPTLELGGEVGDEEVEVPEIPLSQPRSPVQLSQVKPQEPAETTVETGETGTGGGAGVSPEKAKSELPDLPMVMRGDQKQLKELRELGVKKPPRKTKDKKDKKDSGKKGKDGKVAKRPATKQTTKNLKKPAASKAAPRSRKPKVVESGEEESDSRSVVEATQHFSPQSPLEPKNLNEEFEKASEEPKAKGSKTKGNTDKEDVAPAKKRRKGEENKKDDKEVDPTELPNKGTGEQRVSFAGRYCPKSLEAKLRFRVMVATFTSEICPSISGNPSSVEVRCQKQG